MMFSLFSVVWFERRDLLKQRHAVAFVEGLSPDQHEGSRQSDGEIAEAQKVPVKTTIDIEV